MTIEILNSKIDNLTMEETLALIEKAIDSKTQIHHTVVNASKIVAMQSDKELRKSVNNSDLVNADGKAVVWASKILGKPLKERVTGIDLMNNIVTLADKKGLKIYFLGAEDEVVRLVVKKYKEKYSNLVIAGFRNGFFQPSQEEDIAKEISASGAHVLFVAISSPKKEIFLFNNKNLLANVNFIMGVGGSFDVVSGVTKRAPLWMQNSGLEWFYRLIQEPKRMWKRYLIGNTKFIHLVIKEKYFSLKTLKDS